MTNSKITYQSIASIVLSQPKTFSRQGFVTASYRTSRGRKYGPYYRLAYRDQQYRQRSIYLGRSEELAGLVQSLLDKLKTPLRRRRESRGIRVALLANLRTHIKRWKADLAAHGLYLKGFSVRGWRTLHPAIKIKGEQGGRNMDNCFSSSASKQKNMQPKTTVDVDVDLPGKGYTPRSYVTYMRLKCKRGQNDFPGTERVNGNIRVRTDGHVCKLHQQLRPILDHRRPKQLVGNEDSIHNSNHICQTI